MSLEKAEGARLPQPQRELLHRAVVDACDGLDGVKDGLIENPKRCTFDPGVLQCKSAGDGACLAPAQVATARLMYSSPVNPKTKREISGVARGSELGWTDLGWSASAQATGLDQFRFLVFGDSAWNLQKFGFDADVVRAEEADHDTINALDPNLKPFIDRGGKLIQYHGWSDPQISPENSTQYHARVLERLGGSSAINDSYRLFMAPGMAHCGGGSNTLNCMFRFPDVFKVGVSVAPVPDQRLYDTIYQERYMGVPQDNADGYRIGSPINFAEGLKGKLLVVHGSGDDNVHYQGTERLVNRLVELGKPFDLMVYPNRTHGISEGAGTSLHVQSLIARYFLEHLPAGPR